MKAAAPATFSAKETAVTHIDGFVFAASDVRTLAHLTVLDPGSR
jgi:hypothetical protein